MENIKKNIRAEIDALDNQIAKLLIDRFALAKEIGNVKKANGLSIKDLNRENEVLQRVASFAHNEDEKKAILSIYKNVINECCELQKQRYRSISA